MIKLWLDDQRAAPFGWERAKTAEECILRLELENVEEISLDHDLAEEHYDPSRWPCLDVHGYTGEHDRSHYKHATGYEVAKWIVRNRKWPRTIWIHTLNPVGRRDMFELLTRYAPENVQVQIRPYTRPE